MLQQTRVGTVVPYYERFMRRFPTVQHLARAKTDTVLGLWSGLGYYSRARNLHAAARDVVSRFDGRLPADEVQLQSLPGVGRYTAGAIASIAFDRPAPVLDGNVMRVLARLAAHGGPPTDLWPLAAELVPRRRPGDFNQSLMELGAVVCSSRQPDCAACPLESDCRAREAGTQREYPRRGGVTRRRKKEAVCAIVQRGERCLVVQRPADGLLGGLWEFPTFDRTSGADAEPLAARLLRKQLGVRAQPVLELAPIRHVFTHLDLRLQPLLLTWEGGRLRRGSYPKARFVTADQVRRLAVSTLMRKVLGNLTAAGHLRSGFSGPM